MEWAFIGVHIFFVLSGFLITKILCERYQGADHWWRAFSSFWTARAFRIVPLIFLAVAFVAVLTPVALPNDFFVYNLTFTSNFYSAVTNEWLLYTGHFWSIAVEMQFYLVYPFFVWTFKGRLLPATVALMVLLVVVQEAITASGVFLNPGLLLPARADAFLWGGIVYCLMSRKDFPQLARLLLVLGGGLYVAQAVMIQAFRANVYVPQMIAGNVFFAGIVGSALLRGNFVERALSSRPLVHLGKISYGVYVWHLCMWALWDATKDLAGGFAYKVVPYVPTWALITIATIVMSELSWRLLERRLNDTGRRLASTILHGGRPAAVTASA